jgi:hypothetical protein
MSLFKTVFSLPAASFLLTAAVVSVAVASGACSGSSGVTTPTSSPPGNATFTGGTFGGSCMGTVFIGAGTGWAFCDAGKWAYTTTDPSTDGYTPFTPSSDGGPSSDTGPGGDAGGDGGQGGSDGGQGGGSDGGQGHH